MDLYLNPYFSTYRLYSTIMYKFDIFIIDYIN